MKHRIKNIDTGEIKGVIFYENRPEVVRRDAISLLGSPRQKAAQGNFVVETLKGDEWVETDIKISNPIL